MSCLERANAFADAVALASPARRHSRDHLCTSFSSWPSAALDIKCADRVAQLLSLLNVGDHEALRSVAWARSRAGFDLLVVARNDHASSSILRKGSWEGDHIAAVQLLEQQILLNASAVPHGHGRHSHGRRYLDIGANVGYHTLLAASKHLVVDAFEVVPRNAAMINISLCAK